MSKISRSKERVKQTGEVFTPLPLVDEILGKLDASVWDPAKTFIDNSCGDGNFLVRVVAWKIHKGSTAEQALQTTYGVELMPDNAEHARSRVLTNAYVAAINKRSTDDLLPPLTPADEARFQKSKAYKMFADEYYGVVTTNIVCHNALTYDYEFKPQ